jgi:hypothetical protein
MEMTLKEMLKRSHESQFGKMTKEEKSEYFRKLQEKRKTKKGRYSKVASKEVLDNAYRL